MDVCPFWKTKLASAVAVAWDAEIGCITKVSTKLERVVPKNLRPVVDDLPLLFFFSQLAVAAVDVESRPKEAVAVAVALIDFECRGSAGVRSTSVKSRNSHLISKVNALVVLGRGDVVAIVTKPNIGQQVVVDSDISSDGNAVVGSVGSTGETTDSEAGSTSGAEERFAGECVSEAAVAAKNVNCA